LRVSEKACVLIHVTHATIVNHMRASPREQNEYAENLKDFADEWRIELT
jgi:hypothetical protein